MTTKEKVVRESITRITKEMADIDFLINARPLSELLELQESTIKESQRLIKQGKTQESLQLLEVAQKKEEELIAISEKQMGMEKLISRHVELKFELNDLRDEMYFINYEKRKYEPKNSK